LILRIDDETVVVRALVRMARIRCFGVVAALIPVAEDDDPHALVNERFERRLREECGKLRLEMVDGFGKLRTEFGELRGEMRGEFGNVRAEMANLRAEMISRNGDLLKWLLVFFVTQIAAIAALLKLFR
jgi:hypothetical protein